MSLIVSDIIYEYETGTSRRVRALDGVSFELCAGDLLAVVGRTGSGKSTLAQMLNGLLLPTSGRVVVDGSETAADPALLKRVRADVGLVFQYPEQQFFAENVRSEIAFAPRNAKLADDEIAERVRWAAACVGLADELMDVSPFALSGGQRRRVAVASVLSMRPKYLVLDEPTAGLDSAGARAMFAMLGDLRRDGMAVVLITHDLGLALSEATRVLMLEDGRGVFCGGPEDAAGYLVSSGVKGLVPPPLVRFCVGLRARGIDLPLTSSVDDIVAALKARKVGAR